MQWMTHYQHTFERSVFFEKKEKIAIDFCGLARYNVFLHETDLFVSVLTLLEEV